MKIERLLAIVLLLLHRKKVTAQELAERFEVSVRTIYRDLDAIDAAGIPIVSHQGNSGGFAIVDSYRLEKQLLSPDDVLTMVSVLTGVGEALGDRRVLHSGQKVASLYSGEGAEPRFDEIRVELSPWGYRGAQNALLEKVRRATLERKVVRFTYYNSEGGCMERTVEPLTLVFKGSGWYLFGFCRLRADFRLFRLSRMRSFVSTAECFVRKSGSYDDFMARGDGASPVETECCELVFSSAVRFLVEDGFAPEQIRVDERGNLVVTADIPLGDWLPGWLLSFGDDVEVISPKRLRAQVKTLATRVAQKYGSEPSNGG